MAPNIVIPGISLAGADTADGALVNLLHDNSDPALVTGNPLRSTRAQILELREQGLDVVDAMLELILLGIDVQGSPEAAHAVGLGQIKNSLAIGVAQNVVLGLFLLENIVFHGLVSSLGVVRFLIGVILVLLAALGRIKLLHGSADQGIHNRLLLLGHAVHDILNGLLVLGLLLFAVVLGLVLFLVVLGIGLIVGLMDQRRLLVRAVQRNGFIGRQDHFLLAALTVGHIHKVDEGAGIGPGDHQADLTDHAMHDVLIRRLLQPIGVDRQGCDIPMLDQRLGRLAAFGIIERAVGVNAILAVLQKGMAQDVAGFVVPVVPNQGNRLPITILECVMANGASIRAYKIVSGRPATKVILQTHFELFLLQMLMVADCPPLSERLGCCSGARPPWGPSTASCRSSAGSHWRS